MEIKALGKEKTDRRKGFFCHRSEVWRYSLGVFLSYDAEGGEKEPHSTFSGDRAGVPSSPVITVNLKGKATVMVGTTSSQLFSREASGNQGALS